jgi:virginiamycin A acetyltransferase
MIRLLRKVFEIALLRVLRGREMTSMILRRYFLQTYGIRIGLYSYGCFDRWRVPPGTQIGRYCSFAKGVRIINANHPMGGLSTHPYLYDPAFGVTNTRGATENVVVIGDDVWIGHNALLTPGVKSIGRGAIIGAGAVVTHDVAPYAIVAGVPARQIRMRFDAETIAFLEDSEWWKLDRAALAIVVKDLGPEVLSITRETARKLAARKAEPDIR